MNGKLKSVKYVFSAAGTLMGSLGRQRSFGMGPGQTTHFGGESGTGNVGKSVLQEEGRIAASEQVEKRSMNRMAAEASSMNPTDKAHAAHFEHSTDRDQGTAHDAVEKSGGMGIREAMKEAGMKHKGPEEMDVKV